MHDVLSADDIATVASRLIACTLPKDEWTHAAHFAAALWLLDAPDIDAVSEMPAIIRRYNESVGTPNSDSEGYHETITRASLLAARHMRDISPSAPLSVVHAQLMTSRYGASGWLLDHWRKETLFSVKARHAWVAPDIAALPFSATTLG